MKGGFWEDLPQKQTVVPKYKPPRPPLSHNPVTPPTPGSQRDHCQAMHPTPYTIFKFYLPVTVCSHHFVLGAGGQHGG